MLLKQDTLKGIRDGSITLAFRRWKRPTVKAGGALLTPIGQLAIEAVDVVSLAGLRARDARAAGAADLASLKAELNARPGGEVYRVKLSLAGPDPRLALRGRVPRGAELNDLLKRLARMDERSARGPWTADVLALLRDRPAVRAGDLADELGLEKAVFKADVRKLKGLGLTISLGVGYQLSPRGVAVLKRWGRGR